MTHFQVNKEQYVYETSVTYEPSTRPISSRVSCSSVVGRPTGNGVVIGSILLRESDVFLCPTLELATTVITLTFLFRLLFLNFINWWAHGEDRAIACFTPPCKIISFILSSIS